MKTLRAMLRNALAMLLAQAVTWAATFVTTIYLARRLGAADYGKLQLAFAMMAIFAILIDCGANMLITREVARDRDRAPLLLSNALALKGVTAALACVAYAGVVWLMRRPADVVCLLGIFCLNMVVLALTSFFNSFLQGLDQTHHQAWGGILEKIAKTVAVVALLLAGYRLFAVAWAMLATGCIALGWSGYWVLRQARPKRSLVHLQCLRALVVDSLPFFLFAVFAKLYDKIDITMLSLMTNDRVVGWYGAAYRLFETLFFLPYIFNTVAFPALSRLWLRDADAYRASARRSFAFLAAAAVGVSVTTLTLAEPLTDLLYSREEFPGTAPALRILSLALASMYLNAVFVLVLQSSDRQSRWMKAGAVAAVFNPALNYLLIPPLAHLGAAITTVLTELMLMAMALCACPRGIFTAAEGRTLLRAAGAGVILWAGLVLGMRWGLPPALLIGVPLYGAALIGLGVVTRADLTLIRSAFSTAGTRAAEEGNVYAYRRSRLRKRRAIPRPRSSKRSPAV